METRTKLFYPISILCLSLLPFLCWNFWYQRYLKENFYTALEVTYWHPRDATYGRNPRNCVNHIFVKITLDGSSQDQTKLEFGQQMIRRLIQQPGVTRGIEFTLNDNVKYASLVALFDICLVEGARRYIHYGNKFWVFNFASRGRKTTRFWNGRLPQDFQVKRNSE